MPGSPVADIRNSFGAAFVGLIVSTTLLGLTIAQTWIYYWKYRNRDPKALKIFVAFLTVMDALHTILCVYAIYWYLILNFGNLENLGSSMWALNFQILITIVVGTSVQFYYARRVHVVSQSIICPIIIVVLVVIASSLGFFFTIEEAILKQFSRFRSLTWISRAGTIAGAVADLLSAAAMCWSLYRRKTGTDTIIMTLMVYSINSGLLTGAAMTISFVVSPSSLIWLAILWVMSKCYVNSLLAMLNSRDYIRERSTTIKLDYAISPSSIRIDPPSEAYGSKSRQPGISVHSSTTSDFGRNKSDHDVGPTFNIPKPDARITFQSQYQTSESSA
ncbi:hypothetical protein BJY52DRAFT_1184071 [Lactarius psammicola]|nr:hypothetical protein BJY52DRAFT_1184071 [Lactarius psammicola]